MPGPIETGSFTPGTNAHRPDETEHLWVSTPKATVYVRLRDGYVTYAAPIIRWSVGHPWAHLERYILREWGRYQWARLEL